MDTKTINARRFAAWTGIGSVLLFAVGSAIWGLDMPDVATPYRTHGGVI